MRKMSKWLQPAAVILAAFPIYGMLVERADAHVKWFCAFDVAGDPRGLENVLCPDFEYLVGLSILTLMAGCVFEGQMKKNATTAAAASAAAIAPLTMRLLLRLSLSPAL